MSRSAALFWVLIALTLGIIVWFTHPRTVLQSAAVPFLPDFSPAAVARIEIEWPSGERARLDRAPFDPYWLLVSSPKADTPSIPWPAETGRVQGLLRLLAESREGADARAMPTALFLTLHRESGSPIRLAVDPDPLGGKGRIARLGQDGRVAAIAEIDEQFVRALAWNAIDSWRSKDMLFWPTAATTEFRSIVGTSDIDVVKSNSAWVMRSPIAIKADAGAVEGSLLLLSKSGVDRFLTAGKTPDTDWSTASRVLELAARAPGGRDRHEIKQSFEIGPQLDANSRIVRITARETGKPDALWGPAIAIVTDSTLRAIPTEPGTFVSRLALDLPPADIASVKVTFSGHEALVKRDTSGKFGESDATISELLRLICETPAAATRILDTPTAPSEDFIQVQILGPKSESLASLQLRAGSMPSRISGAPSVPVIEIVDRSVARSIPWQRPGDLLAALRALASSANQR